MFRVKLLEHCYAHSSRAPDADEQELMAVSPVADTASVKSIDAILEPDELSGCLKNSGTQKSLDGFHFPEAQPELIFKYPDSFGDMLAHTNWVDHIIDGGHGTRLPVSIFMVLPA